MNKTFWRDRSVFVTGATGLVGSELVRHLLERGAEVVCLVRDRVPQSELVRSGDIDRVRTVRGDVCDQALLERVLGEYETHTVFHLAAQTLVGVAGRNAVSTFTTNVLGTVSLLEACHRSPRVSAVVVASSDKAYGEAKTLPYSEETPLCPVQPYDVSKACTDLITQSYAKTKGLPAVVTRCGNFFGSGDLNWSRIVPGTIRSHLRGQRPRLRSNGLLVRDYFYVEDGALAYLRVAEALSDDKTLRGEAFNFSNAQPISVLDLVERIRVVMGSSLQPVIENNDAVNEISAQHLDSSKARRVLSWQPSFDLDEALTRTVRWYREHV